MLSTLDSVGLNLYWGVKLSLLIGIDFDAEQSWFQFPRLPNPFEFVMHVVLDAELLW